MSEGILSPDELEDALTMQRETRPRTPLGELLLASDVVSPPLLVRLLAQQCRVRLEQDTGFGTGLRRAIRQRHSERARPEEPAAAPVEAPVKAPAPSAGPRLLGELLVAQELLTPRQLEWALATQATQAESGRLLGEIIVQNGMVSMVALVNALVEQVRDTPQR